MTELLNLYDRFKRSRSEPTQITRQIEAEGGEVLEYRHISRLVHSPFHGLRLLPLLYEFRVNYGNRRGVWWVRTAKGDDQHEWAWRDEQGGDTLPIDKVSACVADDVRAVGWFQDTVLVSAILLVALAIVAVIYIFF